MLELASNFFLAPWREISHSRLVVHHSQVQFISKTMYWVFTLSHTMLIDNKRKRCGLLFSRSSVSSWLDRCLITIQCIEFFHIGVHIRTGELRRWASRHRRPNSQGRLPKGCYTLKYQKIKKKKKKLDKLSSD